MKATNTDAQPDDNAVASLELVINDALTYSSAKEFRSREAAVLYKQLIEARQQLCLLNGGCCAVQTAHRSPSATLFVKRAT